VATLPPAITATELIQELTGKTTTMRDATGSHISVVAGCQLFLRFARRTISEYSREPVRPGVPALVARRCVADAALLQ